MAQDKRSHCIKWHDVTWHVATNQKYSPRHLTTNHITSSHPASNFMTSKQVTSPPWSSKRLVHSKEMVWASRWSVALRTFYRQIRSLLYSSFLFWNFRPRLARELLVKLSWFCGSGFCVLQWCIGVDGPDASVVGVSLCLDSIFSYLFYINCDQFIGDGCRASFNARCQHMPTHWKSDAKTRSWGHPLLLSKKFLHNLQFSKNFCRFTSSSRQCTFSGRCQNWFHIGFPTTIHFPCQCIVFSTLLFEFCDAIQHHQETINIKSIIGKQINIGNK